MAIASSTIAALPFQWLNLLLADKERDGREFFHVCDLQIRSHQVSSSIQTFNMVPTNYALVEKHGVILHV